SETPSVGNFERDREANSPHQTHQQASGGIASRRRRQSDTRHRGSPQAQRQNRRESPRGSDEETRHARRGQSRPIRAESWADSSEPVVVTTEELALNSHLRAAPGRLL